MASPLKLFNFIGMMILGPLISICLTQVLVSYLYALIHTIKMTYSFKPNLLVSHLLGIFFSTIVNLINRLPLSSINFKTQ